MLISSLFTSIAWWVGFIMTSLGIVEHTMRERERERERRVGEDGTHCVHSIIILWPLSVGIWKCSLLLNPTLGLWLYIHQNCSRTSQTKVSSFDEIKFFNLKWFFFNYFSLSHTLSLSLSVSLSFHDSLRRIKETDLAKIVKRGKMFLN